MLITNKLKNDCDSVTIIFSSYKIPSSLFYTEWVLKGTIAF